MSTKTRLNSFSPNRPKVEKLQLQEDRDNDNTRGRGKRGYQFVVGHGHRFSYDTKNRRILRKFAL